MAINNKVSSIIMTNEEICTYVVLSMLENFDEIFSRSDHCVKGRRPREGQGQAANSRPPLLEVTAPVLKDEGCCIDIYKRHF